VHRPGDVINAPEAVERPREAPKAADSDGKRPLRVLVVANQWPRPDLPYCGIMTRRQVESLGLVDVAADVLAFGGGARAYLRPAVRMLGLNFGPHRYDLVHAHTGHSGLLSCLQLRYPVVLTYVGYDLDVPAEDREGARTKLERLVFRYLSVVVAGTIAKSARGRARVPGRARNALLPNGVDHELFRPLPRDEARRRLGWDDRPRVLFAADPRRFTKRFELAREAVELAREQIPDLELAVCDSVEPDDVPLWMNAADVLLLTSVAEGSPNVVKEAMACDLPIVSVDVGDVAEVTSGARHCHVCPPDPAALADALRSVVAALPDRSDGRSRVAHLRPERTSRRLLEIYIEACGRGPGPLGFLRRTHFSRRRPLLSVD